MSDITEKIDKKESGSRQVEPIVSRIYEMIDNGSFFDLLDLREIGIYKLSKKQLIEAIRRLNRSMVESTEYWDGG